MSTHPLDPAFRSARTSRLAAGGRQWRHGASLAALCAAVTTAGSATAADPTQASEAAAPQAAPAAASDWARRHADARRLLDEGRTREAYDAFRELAAAASSETERRIAEELVSVAFAQLERLYARRLTPGDVPRMRTAEEMSALYATAFLYGLGSGAWFILETEPSSVPLALAPFAGITIASVGAVSLIDHERPFEPGVPQSLAAGTYLGLGQAAWLVGFQAARASRIEGATGRDVSWPAPTAAGVLWGGATAGAGLGLAVGLVRKPPPGRVSYTVSTALWGGTLGAFTAGALLPEGRRLETSLVIGGATYNGGVIAGLLTGPSVSPSLARVRLVDLSGTAGALLGAATSLAVPDHDSRVTVGAAAVGAAAGLGLGVWLTSSMRPDVGTAAGPPPTTPLQYTLVPLREGAELRAIYTM